MQTIPKKKIIILIIYIIVLAFIFSLTAYFVVKGNGQDEAIPFGNLTLWIFIAVLFSLYALAKPWSCKRKFESWSAKQTMTSQRINGFLILNCFAQFVAPLLYGLILVFWGLSISGYLFFSASTVLDVIVWGSLLPKMKLISNQ